MILLTAKEKSTPLCWGAFGGDAPQLQKNVPRCKGRFFGADNQIRTGDLVLTKDVLYLLSHISKILRATCGKVRIAPRLSLSMIPILPAKVNRLR